VWSCPQLHALVIYHEPLRLPADATPAAMLSPLRSLELHWMNTFWQDETHFPAGLCHLSGLESLKLHNTMLAPTGALPPEMTLLG